MNKIYNVGVIGGGVSGVITALELAKNGVETVLFEQKNSVVNGPPFCHLHAGGNLYPDISDEQCRILMKQSIEMARLFPQSIDKRPTFISIPKTQKYDVNKIQSRLEMLVEYYKSLIDEDPENEILGAPEDYFKSFSKAEIKALAEKPEVKIPSTADEWMTNSLKFIDYEKLKTPVSIVQEYGWNLFRLAAQAQLALNKSENCLLKTNTEVKSIKDVRNQKVDYNWEIHTENDVFKVNYLVNSCGFKTGQFDESLHIKNERLIEFKAAYVSKWQPILGLIPELIFHGERGTPNGMVQLTPYSDDYYQIHGMTQNITLFKDGLIHAKKNEAQPKFKADINQKLDKGWDEKDIEQRTKSAITSVAHYLPDFASATVGGPPLFGAQQIPGDDATLRVGEVSFPYKSYARSEIVKASSALTVANQIIDKIQEEGIIPLLKKKSLNNFLLEAVSKNEIDEFSMELAIERGYPGALSKLVMNL
ncbi:FAD-dependent oxidoreductase [Brumimicrobium aurantiacum]|uniref:FAD-dependent oxidoreductase n=1 Tax=Brumimicrobium aurantiacum TaxID=1737063 RepID=A0A3E1F001_9FLAO|nr:FAD-dependent oxidoreductase [Brumimicrobium aurantiacum]RFC55136.1 FAD-dependent oxidoreductase [Brumimicrobium aurantiacum]